MNRTTNEVLSSTVEQPRENGSSAAYDPLGLPQEPKTFELQAIDVAWLLWTERRLLARFTAVGLIIFLVMAFVLPKRYTATARLMPPDFNQSSMLAMALPALSQGTGSGSSGGGGTGSGLMGLANQLLGFSSSGELYAGVLRSRTIQDDIVNRFGLMKLYRARYPEDARTLLDDATDIEVDQKTQILSLSVGDKDPKRAAAMAQAYVEDLNQVLATVSASSAHRERVFIEQRRSEVKKALDNSAKEFAEFASRNAALDIPEQAKAEVAAAADLQGQLIAAQSMLRGLQQIFTDNNPRVRQMQAQVDELVRQLNKVGGKDVTPANSSVLSSDELYPSVRQLPLLGVRYLDLFGQSKIDMEVYELLSKEYEMAKLEEARDVPTAQVLDAAVVPQKKTSPHRTWIVLGGMCFAFVLGVARVLGEAHWKGTDPGLPWKVFAQEVFATCKAEIWDSPAGVRVRQKVNHLKNKVAALRQSKDT